MKKKNDETFNPKVQKLLSKLISEEQIASEFYRGCIKATCPCQSAEFGSIFSEIAKDELDDHAAKLIAYAIENDYDVPFKYKDYEKYAEDKVVKQFNALKTGEKTKYYISEAVKSEELAIKSYDEAIHTEDIPYDVVSLLYQNYYDELEHYSKLKILEDALKAGAQLKGF